MMLAGFFLPIAEMSMDRIVNLFLSVGLVIVAAIGIGVWLYLERKRREQWQAQAEALGFEFHKEYPLEQLGSELLYFKNRNMPKFKNVLVGEAQGTAVWIGDFHYMDSRGNNSQIYRHTVCLIRAEELYLPVTHVEPETMGTRLIDALTGKVDLDFPEDPEFSKAYVLRAEDCEETRALYAAPMRKFLIGKREETLNLETGGNEILVHHAKRIKPEEVQTLLATAFQLMAIMRSKSCA